MIIKDIKSIHCIGIGGIGVSAIARYFLAHGAKVTGSDVAKSELITELENEGIAITIGHTDTIPETDCVVYSPAVPEDNPERVHAQKNTIRQISYPEMLGLISQERFTIAVTGMHGKSTTTAMLGVMAESAGLDPLVIVGSKVPQFNGKNIRITADPNTPFIVEACEYRGHMQHLSPNMIILTNIDEEHLDYFKGIDHILDTYGAFIHHLPDDGVLIRSQKDAEQYPLLCNVKELFFDKNTIINENISLAVPGDYNKLNAGAVVQAGKHLDIPDDEIKKGLESFTGIWRRFETVGSYQDAEIISDYAHHPTEIKATRQAVHERYPNQKILLVFQPHQIDRTQKLFSAFVEELNQWEAVVVSDIFEVAGREQTHDFSSQNIYDALNANQKWLGGDIQETEKIVQQIAPKYVVIVIMGAGTIDSVARKLSQDS